MGSCPCRFLLGLSLAGNSENTNCALSVVGHRFCAIARSVWK